MNEFAVPIRYDITDQLGITDDLKSLGVTHVLDVNRFIANRRYYPSIGSIFLYGAGGSYGFDDERFGEIYINNGTLSMTGDYDWQETGEYYYELAFDKPIIDYEEYEYIKNLLKTSKEIVLNNVKYTIIPFSTAVQRTNMGELTRYYLDPQLQMFTGSSVGQLQKVIVTFLRTDGSYYLSWARINSETNQFVPK